MLYVFKILKRSFVCIIKRKRNRKKCFVENLCKASSTENRCLFEFITEKQLKPIKLIHRMWFIVHKFKY